MSWQVPTSLLDVQDRMRRRLLSQASAHLLLHRGGGLFVGEGLHIDPGSGCEYDPARRGGLDQSIADHAVAMEVGIDVIFPPCLVSSRDRL